MSGSAAVIIHEEEASPHHPQPLPVIPDSEWNGMSEVNNPCVVAAGGRTHPQPYSESAQRQEGARGVVAQPTHFRTVAELVHLISSWLPTMADVATMSSVNKTWRTAVLWDGYQLGEVAHALQDVVEEPKSRGWQWERDMVYGRTWWQRWHLFTLVLFAVNYCLVPAYIFTPRHIPATYNPVVGEENQASDFSQPHRDLVLAISIIGWVPAFLMFWGGFYELLMPGCHWVEREGRFLKLFAFDFLLTLVFGFLFQISTLIADADYATHNESSMSPSNPSLPADVAQELAVGLTDSVPWRKGNVAAVESPLVEVNYPTRWKRIQDGEIMWQNGSPHHEAIIVDRYPMWQNQGPFESSTSSTCTPQADGYPDRTVFLDVTPNDNATVHRQLLLSNVSIPHGVDSLDIVFVNRGAPGNWTLDIGSSTTGSFVFYDFDSIGGNYSSTMEFSYVSPQQLRATLLAPPFGLDPAYLDTQVFNYPKYPNATNLTSVEAAASTELLRYWLSRAVVGNSADDADFFSQTAEYTHTLVATATPPKPRRRHHKQPGVWTYVVTEATGSTLTQPLWKVRIEPIQANCSFPTLQLPTQRGVGKDISGDRDYAVDALPAGAFYYTGDKTVWYRRSDKDNYWQPKLGPSTRYFDAFPWVPMPAAPVFTNNAGARVSLVVVVFMALPLAFFLTILVTQGLLEPFSPSLFETNQAIRDANQAALKAYKDKLATWADGQPCLNPSMKLEDGGLYEIECHATGPGKCLDSLMEGQIYIDDRKAEHSRYQRFRIHHVSGDTYVFESADYKPGNAIQTKPGKLCLVAGGPKCVLKPHNHFQNKHTHFTLQSVRQGTKARGNGYVNLVPHNTDDGYGRNEVVLGVSSYNSWGETTYGDGPLISTSSSVRGEKTKLEFRFIRIDEDAKKHSSPHADSSPSSQRRSGKSAHCVHCHELIEPGVRFCSSCGGAQAA